MKDRSAARERFLRDPLAVQLGNLASNLARIDNFSKYPEFCDSVKLLIEESKFFIEWAGPQAAYEQQVELVELQIQLARWQLTWSEIWPDPVRRGAVATQSRRWSDRVIELSGLLEAMPVNA